MSDRKTDTVPFSIAKEQISLRLFELPDELIALLSSDASTPLQIKSREPSAGANLTLGTTPGTSSNSNSANSAFAVLCTADKTYQIRQVQTSNSLYVVQADAETGLTAIATCPATIELSTATTNKPNTVTAQQHLRNLLVEWDSDQQPPALPKDARSTPTIYDDIPLSHAEIQTAWQDICAFEYSNVAYSPSSSVLLSAWTTLMNIALAEQGSFNPASLPPAIWQQAAEEASLPQQLFDAIRLRISAAGEADAPQSTAVWLAQMLLDSEGQVSQDKSTFMTRWTELLGEQWKTHATLDAISTFIDQSDSTTVRLKTNAPVATKTLSSTATDATASKRKWHERLKKNK